MKTRTFWHLALKTLGMWLIINGIISLPGVINGVLDLLTNPFSQAYFAVEIAYSIFVITFYFLILQFLVLRSQWTIDFLKLEKGFEKIRINLTIPYNKLLKIIIILIGGILFAKAIPKLAENLYAFFSGDLLVDQSQNTTHLIIYSAQVIISFLIMTNSGLVQRYINRKNRELESV